MDAQLPFCRHFSVKGKDNDDGDDDGDDDCDDEGNEEGDDEGDDDYINDDYDYDGGDNDRGDNGDDDDVVDQKIRGISLENSKFVSSQQNVYCLSSCFLYSYGILSFFLNNMIHRELGYIMLDIHSTLDSTIPEKMPCW